MEIRQRGYTLTEVFEAVGRRLFGDAWAGDEWLMPAIPSPEEIEAERRPLLEARSNAEARRDELQSEMARTVDPTRMKEILGTVEEIAGTIDEIGDRLLTIPEPDGRYRARFATYERRLTAEDVLIAALRRSELKAKDRGGGPIPEDLWEGRKGFGYYLDLNIVVMPRNRGSRRRYSVRLDETEVETWLQTILPLDDARIDEVSPKQRCVLFLSELIREGDPPRPKAEILAEARSRIPDLSARGFNAVWENTVPESWRRSGRRVWRRKSLHLPQNGCGD